MAHNIGHMFYYGERPWHNLGTELNAPADVEAALAAGELDWEVEMVPIVPTGELSSSISHRVAVVRRDKCPGETGRVVGVVHPGFRPLQNRQGAIMFDALLGQGRAVYHTGGYLRNGEVTWLLAKMPADICVRKNDVLETYLLFSNSHDGSAAIDIRLTTVRVVCQNTLSLALNSKDIAGKVFRRGHNGSYDAIKREARDFFDLSVRQSKEAEAPFTRLAQSPCTPTDFQEFLKKLMPEPKKPATADGNLSVERGHETRVETIARSRNEVFGVHLNGIPVLGIDPAENNWWGALNSITAWSDHLQKTESDRYAHALFGSGAKLKANAYSMIQRASGIQSHIPA